jgi:hypothetical protein
MLRDDDRSDIQIANEYVGIVDAASLSGVDNADFGRAKLYCPFGEFYHSDEGRTPALRIYADTNSAWCFACSKYFTPVGMYALAHDLSPEDAAERLLEISGYVRPTIDARWEAITNLRESVDTTALADALRVACNRMTKNWESLQYEEDVSTMFRKCLQLLPKVQTEEQATKWLASTKQIMLRTLGDRDVGHEQSQAIREQEHSSS